MTRAMPSFNLGVAILGFRSSCSGQPESSGGDSFYFYERK